MSSLLPLKQDRWKSQPWHQIEPTWRPRESHQRFSREYGGQQPFCICREKGYEEIFPSTRLIGRKRTSEKKKKSDALQSWLVNYLLLQRSTTLKAAIDYSVLSKVVCFWYPAEGKPSENALTFTAYCWRVFVRILIVNDDFQCEEAFISDSRLRYVDLKSNQTTVSQAILHRDQLSRERSFASALLS